MFAATFFRRAHLRSDFHAVSKFAPNSPSGTISTPGTICNCGNQNINFIYRHSAYQYVIHKLLRTTKTKEDSDEQVLKDKGGWGVQRERGSGGRHTSRIRAWVRRVRNFAIRPTTGSSHMSIKKSLREANEMISVLDSGEKRVRTKSIEIGGSLDVTAAPAGVGEVSVEIKERSQVARDCKALRVRFLRYRGALIRTSSDWIRFEFRNGGRAIFARTQRQAFIQG